MSFSCLQPFRRLVLTICEYMGGASPNYLEYFTGEREVTILVDQLQSEQGARFLHKRNRNIIVEVDADEEFEVMLEDVRALKDTDYFGAA